MNIHEEFETYCRANSVKLTPQQHTTAALFLQANNYNPCWLRARQSGVTTLFNALEDFYKYHEPQGEQVIYQDHKPIENRFWYNVKCKTCGKVNGKAEDSTAGWRFYSTPNGSVWYTCPECPTHHDAQIAFER